MHDYVNVKTSPVPDRWVTTNSATAMALIEPARATRTGAERFLIAPRLPHARPALADPRGVCGYSVLRNTTSRAAKPQHRVPTPPALSSVYTTLPAWSQHLGNRLPSRPAQIAVALAGIDTTQDALVPNIPPKMLYRSLADTTEPKTRHPFQRHIPAQTPLTDQLGQYVRSLRKCISPRTYDVTLRVWWRILPTHDFFWRQGDPTQRYCVHGCQEIETYHHLFWECQHSFNLWRVVLTQWHQILDRPVSWNQALFGLNLSLKRRWQRHRKGILVAWNVTRSIIFSLIWKNRNHRKHQQERPPDPRSQLPIVEHSLRLHVKMHDYRTFTLGVWAVII